jgi:hypothetical protein
MMPHVSRPLIGVLVATVVFFALWVVALKPSSSGTSGNSGLGQYQSAINAAKAAAAANNTAVTTPAAAATTPAAAAAAKPAAAVAPAHVSTPTQRLNVVDRALVRHNVLALLFYNPAAPDDQAVRQELRAIPTSGGRVVKLAVPLKELSSYPVVTSQVLVQGSPTLVIVDRSARAFTLVGFADGFEIAHRVRDALGMH